MNALEITRGGEKHTLNWEVTADGEFDFFATRELKLGGQPVRVEIDKMEQVFTNGRLTNINTYYVMYALDNEGNKIDPSGTNPRYCTRFPMTANVRDRKDFARSEAPRLVYSMWNGYVRSGLKFNYYPPFNSATGEVLAYTPDQEAAAGSGDYFTTNADGTPVNAPTDAPTA